MSTTLPHSASDSNLKLPKIGGVYQIICIPTGRIYVGSTVNLYKRRIQHFSQLRTEVHDNPPLQRAWNKYGESAFTFEILELVLIPEMLPVREQSWFRKLRPFGRRGYNIEHVAGSPPNLGKKQKPQTIEKRVQKLRGKKRALKPNGYRTEEGISYIVLTMGQEAIIDTIDLERVLKVRWYTTLNSNKTAMHARGAVEGNPIFLSHYIIGAKEGVMVNYRNGNTLDNRRSNLRIGQPYHRNTRPNSKTGIQGVCIDKNQSGNLIYNFRCRGCGISKNFPFTEAGLEEARAFSESHHASELNDVRNLPRSENQMRVNGNSTTGIRGVTVHEASEKWGTMYKFRCRNTACKVAKYFPYTEEGLAQAKAYAEAHYAAMKK